MDNTTLESIHGDIYFHYKAGNISEEEYNRLNMHLLGVYSQYAKAMEASNRLQDTLIRITRK